MARRTLTACFAALAILAVPMMAAADALVVVNVRAPRNQQGAAVSDGRVTLTRQGGGQSFSCDTRGGTCRIDHVPGGAYVVTFAPANGRAPAPRNAMIPPTGTVSLYVSPR